MRNFINELTAINDRIDALVADRSKLVSDSSEKVLLAVRKMMDWRKTDIEHSRVEWNSFERAVMVEVTLKNDRGARYVFAIKDGKLSLRFREDYSMHC